MALEAQLNPLNVPSGTEFPGTVQGLLQLIAEYMEITGLADFNGVNYGSVEPDPEDRDKAWLRTDGGGNFLGWYVWSGAAWTILPSKAFVGTEVERNDLANPQEGWMFHVVGTGLSTYTGAEWEWAFPAANEDLVGDKFFYFDSHQSLISTASEQTSWEDIDLSSYITESGIPAANISAAIIRLDIQVQVGFGGAGTFLATIRAWGTDSISASATDVLTATGFAVRDQSAAGANNTIIGPVPMSGGQTEIFYNLTQSASPSLQGNVWLVGFQYTPTLT
jgi:hypothetical protein